MSEEKEGLTEVEQALSVLAGRDPRAVQAEREAREARERKAAELAAQAKREGRARGIRVAMLTAVVLFLAVTVAMIFGARSRAARAESSLAPLLEPYVKLGFVRAPSPVLSPPTRLEVELPEDSCAIVVTTGARARLDRPASPPDLAPGALFHCTCAAERVTASAEPAGAPVALARVSAPVVGGVIGAALLRPAPALVTPGGEPCQRDHLDAFVASGSYPRPPRAADFPSGPLAALAASGFASAYRTEQNLALLDPAKDQCFVAGAESGEIALKVAGATVAQRERVAWCATELGAVMLERVSAKGPIDVLSAPARRVGGPLGVARLLPDAELWIADDQRAALAVEALRSALVLDPTAVHGAIPAAPSARVLALSTARVAHPRGEAVYTPDSASTAFFVCDPPLRAGVREALCVQSAPQIWHPPQTDVPSGAAYGPLPPWMSAFASERHPDAIAFELGLMRLAILMSQRGFEATIIEGVTETEDGVTILGRKGEDAIVAVGLFPGGADGVVTAETYGEPAWTVDGEPTVIPLAPGARLHLKVKTSRLGAPAPKTPLAARRTVVFRHALR